jgi:hypothetical protein
MARERVAVWCCRWNDMAHGVAPSLVMWHSIIVAGDVGHERVAVVAVVVR